MEISNQDVAVEIEASLMRTKLELLEAQRVANSWTQSNYKSMLKMCDEILKERNLHLEASKIWSEYGERYSVIPVLLLNMASGIVNFSVSENVPVHLNYYVGALNLAAAMLTSISQYYKPIEKSEKHLHIARRFGRLHRSILLELGLPKKERQMYSDCIRFFKTEYDNIKTECPILPDLAFERLYKRENNLKGWNLFNGNTPNYKEDYNNSTFIFSNDDNDDNLQEKNDSVTIISHVLSDDETVVRNNK